ncbi:hypothetical protein [Parvibium lacunae]|uniref:Lipoprotein n=1 Tax=Parvibium lacunae TaxID=1888893 RepID=A0A368L3E2_9BURK|nr:hypothetical protein [Parvibium lacunae]RCS58097.1 hypothetical protein DU000_04455 [Parvibium lacunae]
MLLKQGLLGVLFLGALTACQKPEPPGLMQGQREALEKAKAVQGQVQQQLEVQKQLIESQTRLSDSQPISPPSSGVASHP